MADKMRFIDPTARGNKKTVVMVPRPIDLVGKVVGLLDNTKEQSAVVLETIGNALRDRYGASRLIVRQKEHHGRFARAAVLDEMASQADVAIAALGG